MPYSKNANYMHDRQKSPELFARSTFKTVPLSHTKYNGTKYDKQTCLAIVGKLRKNGKWSIQSILVPKKINKKQIEKETGMKVIGVKNYPNEQFIYLKKS